MSRRNRPAFTRSVIRSPPWVVSEWLTPWAGASTVPKGRRGCRRRRVIQVPQVSASRKPGTIPTPDGGGRSRFAAPQQSPKDTPLLQKHGSFRDGEKFARDGRLFNFVD